jgi:hypothetical protein
MGFPDGMVDVALMTHLVVDDARGPALPDDSSPTASGGEVRAIGIVRTRKGTKMCP